MDLTEKGWLEKYIQIRKGIDAPVIDNNQDYERFIYKTFQPTGILYGHPLHLPDFISLDLTGWPIKERVKIIFTEAIMSSGIVIDSFKNKNPDYSFINRFTEIVNTFYTFSQEKQYSFSPFIKSKKGVQKAESILNKRVIVKAEWNASFWQGFFQNLLLFSDVLLIINYINKGSLEDIKEKQESLRVKALTIIASAAFADNKISSSEKKLFEFFVESAELKSAQKKEMLKLIDSSPNINNIEVKENSWLEKKYLLELAILTVWADRNLQETEEDFLVKLNKKMGFDEVELYTSMTAIESFVMNNWERVHYLQSKQNYLIISNRLKNRISKIALKYKHEIANEINESKELVQLINKSKTSTLTVDEKSKIRQQLIDILKSIPAFVIIALPFSFLTLPIIFKILPKSVFPSSFDENRILKTDKKGFISE